MYWILYEQKKKLIINLAEFFCVNIFIANDDIYRNRIKLRKKCWQENKLISGNHYLFFVWLPVNLIRLSGLPLVTNYLRLSNSCIIIIIVQNYACIDIYMYICRCNFFFFLTRRCELKCYINPLISDIFITAKKEREKKEIAKRKCCR